MFEKYNAFVSERKLKSTETTAAPVETNNESLLDFAGASARKGDGDNPKNETKVTKNNVIDELGDIFSTESGTSSIAEPLKPVNLMPSGELLIIKTQIYSKLRFIVILIVR